jgi:2-phospho-L-lactate guanylyltransferase
MIDVSREPTIGAGAWTVVIPVRDPQNGKSRLGLSPSIAAAIAADTVAAAVEADLVSRVVVVTDSPSWATHLGVELVLQRSPGLDGAIRDGLEAVPSGAVAVLVGDVAALRPEDLTEALESARWVDRGYVPDRQGTGTVLITARTGTLHRPRFGLESAAAHASQGYQRLRVRTASTLRLDVDTEADLALGMAIGAGTALRAALDTPATPADGRTTPAQKRMPTRDGNVR